MFRAVSDDGLKGLCMPNPSKALGASVRNSFPDVRVAHSPRLIGDVIKDRGKHMKEPLTDKGSSIPLLEARMTRRANVKPFSCGIAGLGVRRDKVVGLESARQECASDFCNL